MVGISPPSPSLRPAASQRVPTEGGLQLYFVAVARQANHAI